MIVEDDVVIGANAVVIEGIRIGKGAVVAAGAVVIEDVPAGAVVAGSPARVVKQKDARPRARRPWWMLCVSFDLVCKTVSACGRRRFFAPSGTDVRVEPINFSGTAKI